MIVPGAIKSKGFCSLENNIPWGRERRRKLSPTPVELIVCVLIGWVDRMC